MKKLAFVFICLFFFYDVYSSCLRNTTISDIQNLALLNNLPAFLPSLTAQELSADTSLQAENDGSADLLTHTVRAENRIPIADAGPDVEHYEGDTIWLDGSQSFDPEGVPMTYLWTTLNGYTVPPSQYEKIRFVIPKFLSDTTLIISLVVDDGFLKSVKDEFLLKVKHINIAPFANAGTSKTVDEGSLAQLNGSSSYDPEKKPLIYKWTAPLGITLSSENDIKPTFIAPEVTQDTPYVFTLVVNDGIEDSETKQVTYIIRQVNKVPIALTNADFTIDEGSTAMLDGSISTDGDKDNLQYKWTAPLGITLSSTTDSKPTFTAPEVSKDTPYIFTLTVNDGAADSPPSQVTITVRQVNKAPVANTKAYLLAYEGDTVTLDGSLSTDADKDYLTYHWTAPPGIVLTFALAANPAFIAPEVYRDTAYTFVLVVNDGIIDSAPKTVKVAIKNIKKPSVYGIYPNPTTGIVFVRFSSTPDKQAVASIINASGCVMIHKENIGRTGFEIDLSGYPDGFYLLNIREDNQQYNQKIILQRK